MGIFNNDVPESTEEEIDQENIDPTPAADENADEASTEGSEDAPEGGSEEGSEGQPEEGDGTDEGQPEVRAAGQNVETSQEIGNDRVGRCS